MNRRLFSLFFVPMLLLSQSARGDSASTPLPLPKALRIESATTREKIWEQLTPKQKQFAYHLMLAGLEGKKLLAHQMHRHSNQIRKFIFDSVAKKQIANTKSILGEEGFQEYLIYSAKFLDQAGPYAASNRKFILSKSTPDQMAKLIKTVAPRWSEKTQTEVNRLFTDPAYEVLNYPENQEGEGLELSGGNLYDRNITGKEVKAALEKGLKMDLNCRVVKRQNGLSCEVQTTQTPGMVGQTLQKIVKHLRQAIPFAATAFQQEQLKRTILFFEKGNIEDFRQANIAWVKDRASSPVDTMIGWVEVYNDWLARIGSWESYVQIIDPKISQEAQALASHAQYFENAMPYGQFKKTFPENYAPPALMVYYFQERGSYRTGGYNLPNFDDIRRDVGAKNIIRLPLPGETEDPEFQTMWKEAVGEYAPAGKVDLLLSSREKVWKVLVLLHEIIGHGSGDYDPTKFGKNEDPISALGPLGSALEEQRADLAGLVFAGDKALVEAGIYQNQEDATSNLHAMYDYYVMDFLRRTGAQRTFTEAHQRGHWLFVKKLLEAGAIEWASKNPDQAYTPENGVLSVKDYLKFYEVAKSLLGELQTIKATRDEAGLKKLFEQYAPLAEIESDWAKAIIKRGANLKINYGYVEQTWKINSKLEFKKLGEKSLETIAPFWKEAF